MNKISFGSVKLGKLARNHVNECLDTNWITMGKKVQLFEEEFKRLFNYPHCRFLSSGTAADTAACMALLELGLKPGDKVICPALSFIATANAIRAAGLEPVFVDVGWDMNINVDLLQKTIDHIPNIKAIMAVNLMGKPCNLPEIRDIADEYGMFVICDNCEGYGCTINGKYSLEYADMETTSHFSAHILVAGEGGCVFSKTESIDNLIEAIRSHGRQQGSLYFHHPIWGLNLKNTDLHASVGLDGVAYFWKNFAKRKEIYYRIFEAVNEFDYLAYFTTEDQFCENAPHGFSITLKRPKAIQFLKVDLDQANIEWKRNFGSMPTQHGCFSYLEHTLGDFPVAEYIGDNGIHIGLSQYWSDEDVDRIIKTLRIFFHGLSIHAAMETVK